MSEICKARKIHTCIHCRKDIDVGEEYVFRRLTPWDHAENEYFFNYRAHQKCHEHWNVIGADCDWEFYQEPEWFLESMNSQHLEAP